MNNTKLQKCCFQKLGFSFFIWCLTIMCQPLTFCYFHICKLCFRRQTMKSLDGRNPVSPPFSGIWYVDLTPNPDTNYGFLPFFLPCTLSYTDKNIRWHLQYRIYKGFSLFAKRRVALKKLSKNVVNFWYVVRKTASHKSGKPHKYWVFTYLNSSSLGRTIRPLLPGYLS